MPRGGFGNQHGPHEKGNSVFVDDQLRPFDDQWAFLSSIRRLALDEAQALLRKVYPVGDVINVRHGATDDHRFSGVPFEVEFHGDRRPTQIEAAKAMAAYDEGVLCAPTAFGKTAIAASLIALRKVNTLVLVHRRQLMDQWRERLALFLALATKDIGQIGGGKNTQTGRLDVAVIQSLIRRAR